MDLTFYQDFHSSSPKETQRFLQNLSFHLDAVGFFHSIFLVTPPSFSFEASRFLFFRFSSPFILTFFSSSMSWECRDWLFSLD
jgi:hypothetical protein